MRFCLLLCSDPPGLDVLIRMQVKQDRLGFAGENFRFQSLGTRVRPFHGVLQKPGRLLSFLYK